ALSLAAPAIARSANWNVDLNLVLALDVSVSVEPPRWEVQRQGYARAFADPRVHAAIQAGTNGRIAVSLVQWSSRDQQRIMFPWTVLGNEEACSIFSRQLAVMERAYTQSTGVGAALEFCSNLLSKAPYQSHRSVIDISGDGHDNDPIILVTGRKPLALSR